MFVCLLINWGRQCVNSQLRSHSSLQWRPSCLQVEAESAFFFIFFFAGKLSAKCNLKFVIIISLRLLAAINSYCVPIIKVNFTSRFIISLRLFSLSLTHTPAWLQLCSRSWPTVQLVSRRAVNSKQCNPSKLRRKYK